MNREPLRQPQRRSPEPVGARRGRKLPAGVQGRNTGYWQSDGATRSGAKRSKRP
jgi:hypothetical protein